MCKIHRFKLQGGERTDKWIDGLVDRWPCHRQRRRPWDRCPAGVPQNRVYKVLFATLHFKLCARDITTKETNTEWSGSCSRHLTAILKFGSIQLEI